VQLVVADMTFNLGCQGARWPHFTKALETKDFKGAAANMRGTPYCGQVKGRCTRNQALLTSAPAAGAAAAAARATAAAATYKAKPTPSKAKAKPTPTKAKATPKPTTAKPANMCEPKAAPASGDLPDGDFNAKIRALIAQNEGRESRVCNNAQGHPTIGVAYNLDKTRAHTELASLDLDLEALRSGAQSLTDSQIDALFDKSLETAIACAKQNHPGFSTYPENVQLVVADMTFNLGCQGARWPHFTKALEAKDFKGAAANMRGTPYCGQVGGRCTRNQELLSSA
jgi:lysozyme